jgi:hypothetical protein
MVITGVLLEENSVKYVNEGLEVRISEDLVNPERLYEGHHLILNILIYTHHLSLLLRRSFMNTSFELIRKKTMGFDLPDNQS